MRVEGLGFRVPGLGFRVLGLRASGVGLRVMTLNPRVREGALQTCAASDKLLRILSGSICLGVQTLNSKP